MTRPTLETMCPFFIVSGVDRTIAFYCDRLGFETLHQEPEREPFFAIVGRDGAMLFVKAGEAQPLPNAKRDPEMRWDAYLLVNDPDALAAEFADRGVEFSVPLKDTQDGLRGFEISDPDGYVLFFGRPGHVRAGQAETLRSGDEEALAAGADGEPSLVNHEKVRCPDQELPRVNFAQG